MQDVESVRGKDTLVGDGGRGDPSPRQRLVPVSSPAPGFPSGGAAAGAEGEAALRERLAEMEARSREMLARVADLEEKNFELEASLKVR